VSTLPAEREQRVSPLELFFDLVFVFAFTQVTTLLSHNPTWSGLGHGLLLLTTLWWAWAAYAWLTNAVDPEETRVWGTMMVASAAMFVGALAVPEAFARHSAVFGVAFLVVTLMYISLYALSARDDAGLLHAIFNIAPSSIAGGALIAAAGFVHGDLKPLLWLIALVVAFGVPYAIGTGGWGLHPAHFVERHGLIVIIAIGESLVAIGLGARQGGLGAGVIAAAVVGFGVAASFWLAYFDFFTIRVQQLLDDRSGAHRIELARDAFTYLHLPLVVGIVLFAFATKTTLAHVGDELSIIPALALCGGPALFLFAFVGIRYRVSRTIRGGRLVAACACAALVPVALGVPAAVALALVAAVWVALHAYELIWWRGARAEVRAQGLSASAS
jgi:low temperature requirement protein LtrA